MIGFVSVLLSPRFAVTNDLHDSYLSPGGWARNPTDLMRQLTFILTALIIAAFQTRAGILDWLFDAVNKDDIARREAQFLVLDGVSHPSSVRFEKVNLVDKDGLFYLFHVVLTTPGGGVDRYRKSYLVCFRLTEHATEFRILTVIQDASDPPTENEIAIDKRLNRWPVSPRLRAGADPPPYSSQ